MPDHILEISFPSSAALEETVQARLFLSASEGSTSSDAGGMTTISAYFTTSEEREEAARLLADLSARLRRFDREAVDWLEQYEQSLQAMEIGNRFIVAPDRALLSSAAERLPIVVPQEQAFGTGSHETTALCMALLEEIDVPRRRGLDIGSGSGILALAALKLGAARVIAFDHDLDAYAALRENRHRNGVNAGAMPLFIGGTEALRGGRFDFITMNIIAEVILRLLPEVVIRMAEDARLIASGILVERRDDVVGAAVAQRLELQIEKAVGEWWAGVFQRRR